MDLIIWTLVILGGITAALVIFQFVFAAIYVVLAAIVWLISLPFIVIGRGVRFLWNH